MLAALIVGAAVLGLGALVAIRGLLRRGPLVERLRWLVWPMLALVGFISELAYLRLLPSTLLDWRGADKVIHLLLFGALAFCLDLWLRGRDLHLGRLRVPLAGIIVVGGASLEELLQSCSPARSADVRDLLSDLVGIVVAIWIGHRLLRRGAQRSE